MYFVMSNWARELFCRPYKPIIVTMNIQSVCSRQWHVCSKVNPATLRLPAALHQLSLNSGESHRCLGQYYYMVQYPISLSKAAKAVFFLVV